jgi:hypothetical protein
VRLEHILQLVQRTSRDAEKSRELRVGLAAEPLGDVATDGVDGVLGLALQPEITRESRLVGELEHFDAEFVSELPDCQFRKVANT